MEVTVTLSDCRCFHARATGYGVAFTLSDRYQLFAPLGEYLLARPGAEQRLQEAADGRQWCPDERQAEPIDFTLGKGRKPACNPEQAVRLSSLPRNMSFSPYSSTYLSFV